MKPQVGDLVQVKEEHWPTVGLHGGLVTRLIIWPDVLRHLIDCVVFIDPHVANPIQLQTRFVEVISAVPRA
jgi:hypothetical protein